MSRNQKEGGQSLLPVEQKEFKILGKTFSAKRPKSANEEAFEVTGIDAYTYNQGYVRLQVKDSGGNSFAMTLDGHFNPGSDEAILKALQSRPKTINWLN